jgi:hypothetical protein
MEDLVRARKRYQQMMDSLGTSGGLDSDLRRDLQSAITALDAKILAQSEWQTPGSTKTGSSSSRR